ncbi:MAG TPA: hypothetical protein VFH51_15560, partial [Myxococcota bacterium]|nr:hypothetical protein [Myxococcota bacterium]
DSLPKVVAPMQMARPKWTLPGSCKATTGAQASATSGGGAVGTMNWTGNWMANVSYKWTCTVPMSKPERGSDKGNWSLTISGQAPQLSAQVNTSPNGFNLQGSASDKSMRLCGAFPLKGKGGGTPSTQENNVCIVISDISSPNRVVGTAEGDFQTQFGIPCKVSDARVELSR